MERAADRPPVFCMRTRFVICLIAVWLPLAAAGDTTVTVFDDNYIHFTPDDPTRYDTEDVAADDNGRVASHSLTLPEISGPTRITAHLVIKPIPQDELVVHDKWDRAGNVTVRVDGLPLELVKFVTAYGGRTEFDVDLTHLAPVLTGPVIIDAFIDTWVTPAWQVDLDLHYQTDTTVANPLWATPLFYDQSFTTATEADGGIEAAVEIPAGLSKVLLHYLVSGHCTDGRGADEFVSKDNVLSVDGTVVYRYQPWRDDCIEFRAINPYTRRWSDGTWSSDYSRSGWCPGDIIEPLSLNLSDHLPGEQQHRVGLQIEDVRPADTADHRGYWRVSAYLIGY